MDLIHKCMQVLSRRLGMTKLAKEVLDDLRFIRGHRLQPQWYKIFKVFMIFGFQPGFCGKGLSFQYKQDVRYD
jgi:hypothetical protein